MTLEPLELLLLPWFLLFGGTGAQIQPSFPWGASTSAGLEPRGGTPSTSPPPEPETPTTPLGVSLEEEPRLPPLVTMTPDPFRGEEQAELEPEVVWLEVEEFGVTARRYWFKSQIALICTCDLLQDSCDVNCCCDKDCYLPKPEMIFSYCLPGSYRLMDWVCLESSIFFLSNSPFPSKNLVSVNGIQQFCIQVNNPILNYFQHLQKVNETNVQTLVAQYGATAFFSVPQSMSSFSSFYMAGDPILIYFPQWSLLSLFKQPAGVGPTGLCTEKNPARFLESRSTICIRFFRNIRSSCTTDPSLRASSYHNFMVLKVPKGVTDLQNMQVPITVISEPVSPLLVGDTCHNAVSKVIYDIETNGTSGIQKISASFNFTNLSGVPEAFLEQHITIRFYIKDFQKKKSFSVERSGNPGYIFGKPLLVLQGNSSGTMTISQSHSDGSCSVNREKVQFGMNMMTGCMFRIENKDCDNLQEELYKTLSGTPRPLYLGIVGNSDPFRKGDWVKIFSKNCNVTKNEQAKDCTSCCLIPFSLEIQIVWARVGSWTNSQAHVIGGRYQYQCSFIKLPSSMPEISLTTFVSFSDVTMKPSFVKEQPKINWRLPLTYVIPPAREWNGEMESLRSLSIPLVLLCMSLHGLLSLEMN
ncbi:tectonic-3 isoform X1 [Monodelphis domestica]|uniref:tectonic-3 isoform X1 n=2 Tax=Monodelphis domestica TaxID=13616 RepID=UPI0024E201CC|nr:tectonic-3 isoform X1 [Monodelphis domestica]